MTSPFTQFSEWFAQAKKAPHVTEPTAMCVASVAAGGKPSARMVLLKEFDERGFVFYTNFESRKGQEILANANVALTFFWDFGTAEKHDQRQVRIEGKATPVSAAEADTYFASRPFESRIGAWASEQSKPMASKAELMKRAAEFGVKFGTNPPRPPHWSGFRVVPEAMEFWTQGTFRLHTRELFTRKGNGWNVTLLNP